MIDRTGAGVSGVKIDMFQSDPSQARLGYIRTITKDSTGDYSIILGSPSCVVLTFVAPTGAAQ